MAHFKPRNALRYNILKFIISGSHLVECGCTYDYIQVNTHNSQLKTPFLKKKSLFHFYLKGRVTVRKEDTQGNLSSNHHFAPQIATVASP